MSAAARELTQAVRFVLRRPVSSAVIIVTFALGIGANIALFSVAKAIWLDAVPYATAGRAVQMFVGIEGETARYGPNFPEILDLRADARSPLEVTAAVAQAGGMYRLEPGGQPFFTMGVDADIFKVFPETPLLGRLIDAADQTNEHPVALASETFWRRWLGADPSAVGRTLTLHQNRGAPETVLIVGVLPDRFGSFTRFGALVRPLRRADMPMARGNHGPETLYGLLKHGTSMTAARARLAEIGRPWPLPEGVPGRMVLTAEPVRSVIAGPSVSGALAALVGISALVLLIASTNIANLLIAGADDRARELAVRASLGATRWRLSAQLLSESLVLAGAGMLAALILCYMTRDALVALVPSDVPGTDRIGINPSVLAFSLAVTLVSVCATTLWPALRLSFVAPATLLASQQRAGRRSGVSSWLLAGQIAAGVMVVVAGLLLARSFARLAAVDPGFDGDRAIVVSTRGRATSPVAIDAVLDSIRALPMVEAAGITESVPMTGNRSRYRVRPAGAPASTGMLLDYRRISPGYFEALGMRMTGGRPFTAADTRGSDSVAILNAHAARLLFPGQDPLGRKVDAGGGGISTVVGIVADVRHMGLDRESVPEIFRPRTQQPIGGGTFVVRSRAGHQGLAGALRNLASRAEHGLTLEDIHPVEEHVGRSLREPWFRTVLFGAMAGLVLLLTVLGVAALAAHAVIRRTREIGVRMAIGSTPAQAVALLVRQALIPAAAGAALGLIGAWWATRVVGKFLFAVDPRDLPSFAGAAAIMIAAAAIAAWLPARRAARIDPAIALRID